MCIQIIYIMNEFIKHPFFSSFPLLPKTLNISEIKIYNIYYHFPSSVCLMYEGCYDVYEHSTKPSKGKKFISAHKSKQNKTSTEIHLYSIYSTIFYYIILLQKSKSRYLTFFFG